MLSDPLDTLSQLIHAQRAALVRSARGEGVGPEDAVECAHDALCTFFMALRRGEAPAEVAQWPATLFTMTKNAARNRRRRHHVAKPHDDDALDRTEAPVSTAEDALVRAEEHVRLHACIERLCGTQKSVVMLRMLDERAGEDVAEVLGITRGHVDVLLHRAKASLRACMTAE